MYLGGYVAFMDVFNMTRVYLRGVALLMQGGVQWRPACWATVHLPVRPAVIAMPIPACVSRFRTAPVVPAWCWWCCWRRELLCRRESLLRAD